MSIISNFLYVWIIKFKNLITDKQLTLPKFEFVMNTYHKFGIYIMPNSNIDIVKSVIDINFSIPDTNDLILWYARNRNSELLLSVIIFDICNSVNISHWICANFELIVEGRSVMGASRGLTSDMLPLKCLKCKLISVTSLISIPACVLTVQNWYDTKPVLHEGIAIEIPATQQY